MADSPADQRRWCPSRHSRCRVYYATERRWEHRGHSSVPGLTSGPEYAAYVTSKPPFSVWSAAVELGPDRIRVNAVCPGWTRTETSEREIELMATEGGITAEQLWSRLVERLPLGRAADPDEIAACIEFLVAPGASFVTGAVLVADGGGSAVDVGTLGFRS